MNDIEVNRELSSISTLNALSAIGFIVPLIGLIFAGLARGRAVRLAPLLSDSQKQAFEQLIKSRIAVSGNMMLASLLLPLVWMLVLTVAINQ